jgi:uncharacterized protein YukJ
MPIENYGVLKGTVLDGKEERSLKKPHYQIHIQGELNKEYRVAVNVMSRPIHPEVLYLADEDFNAPFLKSLAGLEYGFTPIDHTNQLIALDYIRGNIINKPELMKPLPHNLIGANNDLNDFFNHYVEMAKMEREPSSTFYVFGSKFISNGKIDEIFHFSPPVGIHNVHMNQGNEKIGSWAEDNGIWQDGGILIHTKNRWIAIFLAFQTQSWCTDHYGNPIESCTYLNAKAKEKQIATHNKWKHQSRN